MHCSELVLNEGIFPHTNAGNLTKNELKELKKTNVSMGLMLENSSERLRAKGMPHEGAPSKDPVSRINVLKHAGELKIPMTCLLYTSPSPRDRQKSRMPSSA